MFIQIKNLSKKFKENLAVNSLNFNIEKNKTVGSLRCKWMWKNNFHWYDAWFH